MPGCGSGGGSRNLRAIEGERSRAVDALLHAGLSNAAWAVALALAAAVGARLWPRQPAVAHVLWLLVLLKLVTPSLVHVPATRGGDSAPVEPVEPPSEVSERTAGREKTPPKPPL